MLKCHTCGEPATHYVKRFDQDIVMVKQCVAHKTDDSQMLPPHPEEGKAGKLRAMRMRAAEMRAASAAEAAKK